MAAMFGGVEKLRVGEGVIYLDLRGREDLGGLAALIVGTEEAVGALLGAISQRVMGLTTGKWQ